MAKRDPSLTAMGEATRLAAEGFLEVPTSVVAHTKGCTCCQCTDPDVARLYAQLYAQRTHVQMEQRNAVTLDALAREELVDALRHEVNLIVAAHPGVAEASGPLGDLINDVATRFKSDRMAVATLVSREYVGALKALQGV